MRLGGRMRNGLRQKRERAPLRQRQAERGSGHLPEQHSPGDAGSALNSPDYLFLFIHTHSISFAFANRRSTILIYNMERHP
jgi:hypothetical protein